MTARAMTWAQLWRSTSSAAGSLSVRTWKACSPSGNSRSRSTTSPSSRAATAAWASRLPMPSATWRAVAPWGASLAEPSGSFRVGMGGVLGSGAFAVMLRSGHHADDRGSIDPVLHLQAGNLLKVLEIARDQRSSTRERNAGDQQIGAADLLERAILAQPVELYRCRIVERDDRYLQEQGFAACEPLQGP